MTHYIVTGAPRSGTSMMMRCIEFGGIPCHYMIEPGGNKQNKYGNYEPSCEEYLHSPIGPDGIAELFKHPGECIKLRLEHLMGIPDNKQFNIVIMTRDPGAITESARAVWEKSLATEIYAIPQQYYYDIGLVAYKLSTLKNCAITILNYDLVIQQPRWELQKLVTAGWLINVDNAVAAVDPSERHYGRKHES